MNTYNKNKDKKKSEQVYRVEYIYTDTKTLKELLKELMKHGLSS